MSDRVPDLQEFETEEPDFPEIITLKPGEEPAPEVEEDEDDGKVVLSKEEFEALKKGTDSNSALLEGFKGLQDALKQPSREPVNVQQKPGESDEEFEKRLEKELFNEGKTGKAIKEAIQRYGGSQVSQLMGIISQQNKQIIEMHPEKGKVFGRYKGEIEQFVKGLPPEQQGHPQVWDYALEQVKLRHQDDIVNETVQSKVEELVQARLKELGFDGESQQKPAAVAKKPSYVGSGQGAANVKQRAATRKVYVSAEDEAAARASGLPVEHYLRKIGKL